MTGIDTILSDLATEISELPYIGMAYGRAQIFRENVADKGIITLPKALLQNGDYANCLPNDTYMSQTYFIASGHEKYGIFDRVNIGQIHRQFAIVFWGNIQTIDASLEAIKFDVIKILQKSQYISSIDDYTDENYTQVFPEFTYWLGKSASRSTEKKEADTNWMMFPNAGFRLLFTANYIQPC